MNCPRCKKSISPELKVVVDELKAERSHCPYCLEIVSLLPDDAGANGKTNGAELTARRKEIRAQFADRLRNGSSDGRVHCPSCERTLNDSDEQILRDKEYFRCHSCGRDLATVAYQQEVYHEQRWLPVVAALGDLHAEKKCADCCYLGAIAKACQSAFSFMPQSISKPTKAISNVLRRTDWRAPDCAWESCVAVKQYRKTAGEALQVL